MALDRQSIARRGFPTQRRGYDPAAVDAHLEQLAGEVEALQRRVAAPTASEQAAKQVKAIVEAAERGAQEIRESARAEARGHLARATEAADRLSARIQELVAGAERLRDDLAALRAEVEEAGAAATAAAEPAPPAEPVAPTEPTAAPSRAASEPAAPATGPPPAPNGDAAAARIVALDMALSGAPREETERYLAEHYDVPDREALLDGVYAAAGA